MKSLLFLALCLLAGNAYGQADPTQKDFYYSYQQSRILEGFLDTSIEGVVFTSFGEPSPTVAYFKGQMYTLCVDHNQRIDSLHFKDFQFLGTGTYSDITIKKRQ